MSSVGNSKGWTSSKRKVIPDKKKARVHKGRAKKAGMHVLNVSKLGRDDTELTTLPCVPNKETRNPM